MGALVVEQTVEQVGAVVSETLKRTSIWWLVRAAISIILGVLVLVWPQSTVNIIAILAGLYFVLLGVIRLVEGIFAKGATGSTRTANIVLGALVLVLGIVVMRNPGLTALIVIVIVGLSWVLEGIATVAAAAAGQGNAFTVVLGLLVALAGVLVVIFADGALIAWAILIGIALLAVGVIEVILFFVARSTAKRA